MKTNYILIGVGAVVALGLAYKFLWKKDEAKSGIIKSLGYNQYNSIDGDSGCKCHSEKTSNVASDRNYKNNVNAGYNQRNYNQINVPLGLSRNERTYNKINVPLKSDKVKNGIEY